MRKLTAASLATATFLSLGAGTALASSGESHRSTSARAGVTHERATRDGKFDRSREHTSQASRDANRSRG